MIGIRRGDDLAGAVGHILPFTRFNGMVEEGRDHG